MNACSKKHRVNCAETCGLGVPEILQAVTMEKPTVPITVKLQPSLAEYVRQHGPCRICSTARRKRFHPHLPARLDTKHSQRR